MTTLAQYRADALAWAESQIGHGYLMGAVGPAKYDCRGLAWATYEKVGVNIGLDGSSGQFLDSPVKVSGPWIPGQQAFFWGGEPSGPRPGHTGIFVGVIKGEYTIISAYDEAMGVCYSTFVPIITNGHDGLSYMGRTDPCLLAKGIPHQVEPTLLLTTPVMTGAAVELCQTELVRSGCVPAHAALVRSGEADHGIDGVFGKDTKLAVEYFQQFAEITCDGIVGPVTWAALEA
jgi:peptidoglycan hydrolase-like protein with peptidoglycan-binding domain